MLYPDCPLPSQGGLGSALASEMRLKLASVAVSHAYKLMLRVPDISAEGGKKNYR